MLESWKGSLMSSAPKWYIIWQVRYVDLTRKLMKSLMNKREFLTASVGAGLGLGGGRAAFAQQGSVATLRTAGDRRGPPRVAETKQLVYRPPRVSHPGAAPAHGLLCAQRKTSWPPGSADST